MGFIVGEDVVLSYVAPPISTVGIRSHVAMHSPRVLVRTREALCAESRAIDVRSTDAGNVVAISVVEFNRDLPTVCDCRGIAGVGWRGSGYRELPCYRCCPHHSQPVASTPAAL